MGKAHSPLLGFNNNVRHKNRVFHIQTEDSGIKHPHIITHLFMDGGRILKSVKKSYAEHVGADAMQDTVRQMMKEQHKAMFIALRDGQFDHVVDEQIAAKAKYDATAPAPAAGPGGKSQKLAAPKDESIASVDTKRASAAPAPPPADVMLAAAAAEDARAPSPTAPAVAPEAIAQQASQASEAIAKAESKHPPAESKKPESKRPPESKKAPPRLPSQAMAAPPLPPRLPTQPLLRPSQLIAANAPSAAQMAAAPSPQITGAGGEPRSLTPGGKHRLVVLPEPDESVSPTTTRDPDRAAPPPSLDIDLDSSPRPPEVVTSHDPALFRANDLPPPPQNLFSKRGVMSTGYRDVEQGGSYRGDDDRSERVDRTERVEPPRRPKSSPPPKGPPSTKRSQPPAAIAAGAGAPRAVAAKSNAPSAAPGRYAPARPATIFGQPRAKGSLFGDDLVTDKSLDEVILSYLAEDLEQGPKKK